MKVCIIIAAAVIGGAVLAGGCGSEGDDSLKLEEYFQELEAVEVEVEAQLEEVYAAYPEDQSTLMEDEANLPLLKDLAAGFPRVFAHFGDAIAALDPPSEAEASHGAMVAAANEAATLFDDGIEILDGAQTVAEFEALNAQVEATLEPALTRFDDACFDLALLAAENDVDVELDCAE